MKILIVDDSKARVSIIEKKLLATPFYKYLNVVYCDSADEARMELVSAYDLMLLDVLIPKKKNGTPQAKNSILLLSDICSSKKSYIRPRLIIGLTADVNELGKYREEFEKEAAVVLRGVLNETEWLDRLVLQIESVLGSQKKVLQQDKNKALISVHGIRTYGHWQRNLNNEILQHSRSFEFIEIKYGYFDIFSFFIPTLRKKAVAKEAKRVMEAIAKCSDYEVYVVAHSFGTLIVNHALKELPIHKRLAAVVFCGSPLPHSENIDHVVESANISLNECGTRDLVLILARLFVPGLGDAGRVGFQRENSNRFTNRYFRGGHGLYFGKFNDQSTFYEKFWMRLIAYGESVERFDVRRNYFGEDFVDLFIKFMSITKPVFVPAILLYFGLSLWR